MTRSFLKRVHRIVWSAIPPLVDETLWMTYALGYIPNIRHPRTFNEKIAHRKLFTRDERFVRLADKWAVREYVKKKVGRRYLTEVYEHITDVSSLDFEALPASFVVKGRHDSGSTVLIDNKHEVDRAKLLARLQSILDRVYAPHLREYWYSSIPRGIIFEERLRDRYYNIPLDFKFLVFHGTVRFVQVYHNRFSTMAQRIYDRSWTPLSVQRPPASLAPVIRKPRQLEPMIEVAEALAGDLDFVRVDLYAPNDERVVFGELTFAPASGRRRFVPRSFDWELGRYW